MQNIKNMTTEELEQIIQEDIADTKEYDTGFILAVCKELASRQPKGKTAEQAYKEFLEHYAPKEEA